MFNTREDITLSGIAGAIFSLFLGGMGYSPPPSPQKGTKRRFARETAAKEARGLLYGATPKDGPPPRQVSRRALIVKARKIQSRGTVGMGWRSLFRETWAAHQAKRSAA